MRGVRRYPRRKRGWERPITTRYALDDRRRTHGDGNKPRGGAEAAAKLRIGLPRAFSCQCLAFTSLSPRWIVVDSQQVRSEGLDPTESTDGTYIFFAIIRAPDTKVTQFVRESPEFLLQTCDPKREPLAPAKGTWTPTST